MSGVGSESRETGYPWMGKLGKKIGESRVSPDENDTCPDGSWAGPLGKPQEVSPAPTPTDERAKAIVGDKCLCLKEDFSDPEEVAIHIAACILGHTVTDENFPQIRKALEAYADMVSKPLRDKNRELNRRCQALQHTI